MSFVKSGVKHKLLSKEEEAALIKIIRTTKDNEIKNRAISRIVENHLPFIISVARKYTNQRVELDELINEGIFGIYKAFKYYDPEKKIKFLSYAVWWIRQSIQNAIYNQSNDIKVPDNNINRIYNVLYSTENDTELFDELKKLDKGSYRLLNSWYAMNPLALNAPVQLNGFAEGDLELIDTISQDDLVKEKTLNYNRNVIYKAMKENTTPQECKLLTKYYGFNSEEEHTFDELCDCLQLSRERIRMIKKNIVRRLKPKMAEYKEFLQENCL